MKEAAEAKLKAEEEARAAEELRFKKEQEAVEVKAAAEALKLQAEQEARAVAERRMKEAEEKLRAYEEAQRQQEIEAARLKAEQEAKAVRIKAELEMDAARMKTEEELAGRSATTIQMKWVIYKCTQTRKITIRRIVLLQTLYRGFVARKETRQRLCVIKLLQATWRRKAVLKSMQNMNLAAVRIQMSWKSHVLCRSFQKTISAVRKLNTFCRMALAKFRVDELMKLKAADECYQSKLTNFCNRTITRKRVSAVTFIVTFFRSAVVKWRSFRAARSIQSWFRVYRAGLRARKLIRGFRRLPAFWRSHLLRRKSSPKVKAALARIKRAEINAINNPTLQIGKRTQVALDTLLSGEMVSHVMGAVQSLELFTCSSKRCCEAFENAAAAHVLFTLLRSCNRSTPHQELLRLGLIVLLNVGRHGHLAASVAEVPDAAEALIDLMQMFRDKKNVFILATELLSRLVHASTDVKDLCNTALYRKRIDGIRHIIERKHRLEVRVSAVSSKVPKVQASSETKDFDQYKSKNYARVEPVHCIEHLLQLIDK